MSADLQSKWKWLIVALFIPCHGFGQEYKHDKKLQRQLDTLVSGFHGTTGVYVLNLKSGKEAGVNADSVFPTASIVKVPILIGLFDKIEKGTVKYHQEMIYHDSTKYGGSGLMQFFKDSSKTEVSILAALMIGYSDNTTSLWNQSLAGGGTDINALLDRYGYKDTRVNSRTPGREKIREVYGWGQTTPREMAHLLTAIREGKILSTAACEEMYRLMSHVYYDGYAVSQIPPFVQVASKQGMVDDSRSELVMVNAPHGDYVFYIATKNIKDQSWKHDNEAWQLARKLSAMLWSYYEPGSGWKPAPGAEKYAED